MTKKQEEYFFAVQNSMVSEINSYVNNFVVIANLLANDTELASDLGDSTSLLHYDSLPSYQRVSDHLTSTQSMYPEILNFGVGSVAEDVVYIQGGVRVSDGYSLKESVIFNAVTNKSLAVSQPYVDAYTGHMVVSISQPILHAGEAVGLVVIDLSLEEVSILLGAQNYLDTGSSILLSSENSIMSYSDSNFIGSDYSTIGLAGSDLAAEVNATTNAIFPYEQDGTNMMGLVSTTTYGWKLLIGVSETEFYQDTFIATVQLVFLLGCTVVIMTIVFSILISKKLKPISSINSNVQYLGKGELEQGSDVIYRGNDEISEIVASLKETTDHLSSYVSVIDQTMADLAKGDLSATIHQEFLGSFASIKISINEFITKLAKLLSDISNISNEVHQGAEQVSGGAQILSEGAQAQSIAIEDLVSTIGTIKAQITQNNDEASLAAKHTSESSSALNTCHEQMQILEVAMANIKQKSDEINGITKTIDTITFQTNILALNAAVEAARAGTAGKSFAVVANEVRELATKTADASEAISNLIEQSILTIEEGMNATQSTSSSLSTVLEKYGTTTDMVHSIVTNTNVQMSAIKDIAEHVEQIASVVATNTATAEEAAASSEELTAHSEQLKQIVSQFQLHAVGTSISTNVAQIEEIPTTSSTVPTATPHTPHSRAQAEAEWLHNPEPVFNQDKY